jgi:3',5'-cyclic AMP phosphodiesterase CpdA
MKRIAWLTDLHLNFVTDDDRIAALVRDISDARPDTLLVGGDIGEAPTFASYLDDLATALKLPIYFVLGNHDYYKGSVAAVRDAALSLSQKSKQLTWLPDAGVVPLTEKTSLIGHGGWGDGRAGNFLQSGVVLNDYLLIEELRDAHGALYPIENAVLTVPLLKKLQALGDEAADHFRAVIPSAIQTSNNILVLTHVPPFREACWHEGNLSDDNWAPHFVCQAVGEVLVEFMRQHPEKQMTVLCGHTHSFGRASILDNLEVLTGQAKYGEPIVQQVLNVQ